MFPVFFGSALKRSVEEFMEALDLYTCQKEALDIFGIVLKRHFINKTFNAFKKQAGLCMLKMLLVKVKVDELKIYTRTRLSKCSECLKSDISLFGVR